MPFSQCIDQINQVLWGPVMLTALIGLGLHLSLRLGFFQLTKAKLVFQKTFGAMFGKKRRKSQGVSPFAALSTALAGTMGVGNIAGVATALTLGGPGAIFWMWVSAFFGMMVKYAEVVLAVHYREKGPDGQYRGGPMHYIQKGLHAKPLAAAFAGITMVASFGTGNITQSYEAANALSQSFGFLPVSTGLVMAVLVFFVLCGGVGRIMAFTQKGIPFISLAYLVLALGVLAVNWRSLGTCLQSIFTQAFDLSAAGWGIGSYAMLRAMRFGLSRGIFTNEAGLGASSMAHACADTDSPVEQGMWGILEVFIDTIVVCTVTALVILSTNVLGTTSLDGCALTSLAFSGVFSSFGGAFISLSVVIFALCSMVGWAFYGESCVRYLFGGQKGVFAYRFVFSAVVLLGACLRSELAWSLSDTLNALMAIPNCLALILLSPCVIKLTKAYLQKKQNR